MVDHVYDLGPAMGVSGPAARRRVDGCVQEKLAYLFANAADPCIGLTDAGRSSGRRYARTRGGAR